MGEHRPHPLGGQMSDLLAGLANRFGIDPFATSWRARTLLGLFAFADAAVSFAIVGTLAAVSHQPLVFPSLGPTAFLLAYRPLAKSSAPRNILLGHLIGVVSGYVALFPFGRQHAVRSALQAGLPAAAVAAAALSLALTASLMVWLDAPHPPAAATTLIISLGFMIEPLHFLVLMAAVALLVVQDVVVKRFAGIDGPLWAPQNEDPQPSP